MCHHSLGGGEKVHLNPLSPDSVRQGEVYNDRITFWMTVMTAIYCSGAIIPCRKTPRLNGMREASLTFWPGACEQQRAEGIPSLN